MKPSSIHPGDRRRLSYHVFVQGEAIGRGVRDVEGEGDELRAKSGDDARSAGLGDGLRAPRPLLVEDGGDRRGTRPLGPSPAIRRVSSGRGREREGGGDMKYNHERFLPVS